MFKNDEKQNKYDIDFFIKDIDSLEKELDEAEIEAINNKVAYNIDEVFDEMKI